MNRLWPVLAGFVAGILGALLVEYVVEEVEIMPFTRKPPTSSGNSGLFQSDQDRSCDWCGDDIPAGSLAGFVGGDLMCQDCHIETTGEFE